VGNELLSNFQLGEIAIDLFGMLAIVMAASSSSIPSAPSWPNAGATWLLRAVGATRRTVVGVILAESLVQGVIAQCWA